MGVLCCVTFHPLCELSDYTVVGTALSRTLTVGMPATGPGVSQVLFSLITSIDPLKSGPGMAVLMDLDPLWALWGQLRVWPGATPACMCPQSLQPLKLDLSCLWEYSSIEMFCRC